MDLRGKKLGLLLSAPPEGAGFLHGIRLAEAALDQGVDVFLYCVHDAVAGVGDSRLQSLRIRGLKLYACAYGAQKRNIPVDDKAIFAGLGMAGDIMAGTDRFLCFNSTPEVEFN